MRRRIKYRGPRSLILSFMICLLFIVPAMAGDGSSSEPLVLESSSVADGAVDVEMSVDRLTLTFSKNVVNMAVKDQNAQCFTITADDSPVPFAVEMADDQLYRDLRHDIVLIFNEPLQPATTYTVTVSPDLQSKSGVTLGGAVEVSFTTEGDDTLGDDKKIEQENNAESSGGSKILIILVLAAAAAAAVYVIVHIRKE